MTTSPLSLCAPTVLLLAGSAHGFIANFAGIQPNEAITPSAGVFVNYYQGVWLGNGSLVTGDPAEWNFWTPQIEATSWLAMDRYGAGAPGSPGAPLYSDYVSYTGIPLNVPETRADTGNYTGTGVHGVDHGILMDIPGHHGTAILGGADGITWGSDTPSAVSPLNGGNPNAVFIGNFVLQELTATLTGADLVAQIDGVDMFLALDGTPNSDGYSIVYEDAIVTLPPAMGGTGRQLRAYIVPGPGVAALLIGAGAVGLRRRRR